MTLEDAERKVWELPFGCIFIDFMMEDKKGIEFIAKIRKVPGSKNKANIPIILNTAVTDIETVISARDAGVTEIVSKPFSPDHILMKLKSALNNEREFINVDDFLGPNRRRRRPDATKWDGDNDRRGK